MTLVAAAAVAIVWAASGGGSEGAVGAPDPESTSPPVVDCESRTQVIPAARRPGRVPRAVRKRSVVAGPLMFMGAKNWGDPNSEPSRTIKPRRAQPGRLQPAKIPILAKARRTVVVSVFPSAGRRAVIEVGNAEGPPPWAVRGRSVELRSCPADAEVAGRRVGRRTPFLGGFRVDGWMCLRVRVEVEGRGTPILRRIGFGKRPGCTPRIPGRS